MLRRIRHFMAIVTPRPAAVSIAIMDGEFSASAKGQLGMRRSSKFANPFYALLLVAGIAFALTATAYGVMAFREARPQPADAAANESTAEHPLMEWMSNHGEAALLTELGFLAVFVFGAIGTDEYWQRRIARKK
jgi:hypothetical protein